MNRRAFLGLAAGVAAAPKGALLACSEIVAAAARKPEEMVEVSFAGPEGSSVQMGMEIPRFIKEGYEFVRVSSMYAEYFRGNDECIRVVLL